MSTVTYSPIYKTDHYFECHITVPYLPDKLDVLQALVVETPFKVAKLFLEKGVASDLDSFMTARGKDYDVLLEQAKSMIRRLKEEDIHPTRMKIENILLDIKLHL